MSYLDMFGGVGPFGGGIRRKPGSVEYTNPAVRGPVQDFGTVGFDDTQLVKPGIDYARRAQAGMQVGDTTLPTIPIAQPVGTGFTQPDPVTGTMPRQRMDNSRKDAIRAAGATRRQARQAAARVNDPTRRGTVRPPAGGGRV